MPDLSLNPDIGTQRAPRVSPYPDASLYLDFLTMSANFMDSRITFSRGTNATLTDSTGRITYAPANLLVRSQEFDNAAWAKSNTTVSTGVADPLGGTTACTVTATASSGHILQQVSLPAGINAIPSIWLRRRTGTGAIRMWNAAGGTVDVTSSVTSTWTRIQTPVVACSAGPFLFLQIATSGDAVDVWGAQLEPVTYQTTPSTYVATTSAAYYGPRFDYDPVTLAPRGLLIEEQRTNLLVRSEEFDNAAWGKTDVTTTANSIVSPDGTVTADLITDGSAGTAALFQSATVTVASPVAVSVFAKRGNADWLLLQLGGTGTERLRGWFNLATGAVGSVANVSPATGAAVSIVNVGNGWYRCTLSGTLNGAGTTCQMLSFMASADASTTRVNNATRYFWGAQLEAGSFATSYIPTVASTVTRNADVATMTGTNFSSWYNQSEGTFVYNATSSVENSSAGPWLVNVTAGANANSMYSAFADTRQLRVYDGSAVEQVAIASSAVTVLQYAKVASTYKLNDFAVSANGGAVATDTSGTVPAPTQMFIGGVNGSFNGWIAQIAYFNTRLSNSQLQTLTAPSLSTTLNLDFINNVYNVGF